MLNMIDAWQNSVSFYVVSELLSEKVSQWVSKWKLISQKPLC